jgi:hypothetical protein
MVMFKFINLLFAPEDTTGGGKAVIVDDKAFTQQGLEDFLKDDEETPEEEPEVLDLKPEKVKKDEKEDDEARDEDETEDTEKEGEDDEKTLEDELEEDLAEPDEDKLEALVTPVRRKEILTKYPNLFKEFPYLEHAYYREQRYTEIFPTIKEAEAAVGKADTWDKFEGELESGDLKGILGALAEHNKNAFHKVADTILNDIENIDPAVGMHIYSGISKRIIEMMVEAGNTQGNESLKAAAHLMHQFLFGARPYEEHRPLHKPIQKDPRAEEISEKERQFLQRQFTTARDEVGTRVNNSIKATIERNIDPRNSMTEYVKNKAVGDVLTDVKEQMAGDKRFQKILTQLWQQAVSNDFSDDSKRKIQSAVMSKAKQLLLPAIEKGRKTALGSRVRVDKEVTRPEKTGPTKPGKSTTPSMSGKSDRERARNIPRSVSTRDFLMND